MKSTIFNDGRGQMPKSTANALFTLWVILILVLGAVATWNGW